MLEAGDAHRRPLAELSAFGDDRGDLRGGQHAAAQLGAVAGEVGQRAVAGDGARADESNIRAITGERGDRVGTEGRVLVALEIAAKQHDTVAITPAETPSRCRCQPSTSRGATACRKCVSFLTS
jgi:hypothetical protein